MKKPSLIIMALLSLTALGCVTTPQQKVVFPKITNFIGSHDFARYQKIAVLPFMDAPYAPYSGQVIQGLVSQSLGRYGFHVIERTKINDILREQQLSLSGAIDPDKSIEIGKILGVNALVVGEVGQFETRQRKTDTVYFPIMTGGVTNYYPIRGKEWNESFVAISLRIIDVETGQLIYSGSGQFDVGISNPPQESAVAIIDGIHLEWIIPPGMCGFYYETNDKGERIVLNVTPNSPADKAGLMVGDIIKKVKEKDIDQLSNIELKSLTWGYPGEILNLEIDRNGELIQFNIKRVTKKDIESLTKQSE